MTLTKARKNQKMPSVHANHPLRALTTLQLKALQQWINHYRQNWKQELRHAWLHAGARAAYYTPELQQIRNSDGNALLEKISFADVEALLAERLSTSAHGGCR